MNECPRAVSFVLFFYINSMLEAIPSMLHILTYSQFWIMIFFFFFFLNYIWFNNLIDFSSSVCFLIFFLFLFGMTRLEDLTSWQVINPVATSTFSFSFSFSFAKTAALHYGLYLFIGTNIMVFIYLGLFLLTFGKTFL